MKKFLFALAALFTLNSSAHAEWVRYQNYKVGLEVPKQWQVVKDLYGMPITVLGPERGGERAVLLVQHTPLREFKFNHADIAGSQNDYLEGRKEWLSQLDGSQFVSAIPYRKLPDQTGLDGFEIGFRYQLRGHQFEERSVQVNCGGRFYFLKTLSSDQNTPDDKQSLASLVNQFQCAAVTEKDGKYVPGPLHEIQDLIRQQSAQNWPSTNDWKGANTSQKASTIAALVEFYKSYDAAADDDTEFSQTTQKNPAFALFKAQLLKLLPGANAKDGYDCFFGGWPSRFKKINGKVSCNYPESENESYPKGQCASGQMACNPSLFGKDLCVDVSEAGLRSHATMACEQKFQYKGHTFEELVKTTDYDSTLLEQTIDSAKEVCTSENNNYLASNYGLCHTLEQKLGVSITSGKRQEAEGDKGFIDNLETLKKPELQGALTAVSGDWKTFEKDCFDDKGEFLKGTGNCDDRLVKITDDFERIEKTDQKAAQTVANSSNPASNTDCVGCHQTPAGAEPDQGVPDAGGKCTPDETKKITAGKCEWSSATWWLNTGGSCAKNLFTSLLNDLWSTVKGVKDLVVGGLKAGYHWFKGLVGLENETANKAHQASQTSNSFLKQLITHPIDTVSALLKSIMEAIYSFAQNDLLCQSWSGTPHLSTCLAPANFACLPCTTTFNGVCSLAGYAIGEVLPAFLTGGASALAKDGAMAAKLGSVMSKASKEGKLLRFVGEIESKLPKLGKLGLAKKIGLAEKAELGVKSASVLSRVKNVWSAVKDFKKAFTSKWFGKFNDTLTKLKKLKAYTIAEKVGAVKVAKIGKSAVVGTGRLAKNIVTLPFKPYQYAYKFGFKTGERIADKAFLKAAKAEAAANLAAKAGAASEADDLAKAGAAGTNTASTSGAANNTTNAAGATNAGAGTAGAGTHVPPAGATAATSLPPDFIFPQATRIAQKTGQVEADLKAFRGFKFDSKATQAEAQALMKEQRQLINEMKKLNTASKVSTTATAEERIEKLNQAKEAAKKFTEMRANSNKLLALVKKEDKTFKLAEVSQYPDVNSRMRTLIYSPVLKKANQINNQGDNVATIREFKMSNKEINEAAKEQGIKPEALKTKFRKQNADEKTQIELRDKMLSGQTLTKADETRLEETGMTKETMVGIVGQSIVNILTPKVEAKQPLTAQDEALLKQIGMTKEEFENQVKLQQSMQNDPNASGGAQGQ